MGGASRPGGIWGGFGGVEAREMAVWRGEKAEDGGVSANGEYNHANFRNSDDARKLNFSLLFLVWRGPSLLPRQEYLVSGGVQADSDIIANVRCTYPIWRKATDWNYELTHPPMPHR